VGGSLTSGYRTEDREISQKDIGAKGAMCKQRLPPSSNQCRGNGNRRRKLGRQWTVLDSRVEKTNTGIFARIRRNNECGETLIWGEKFSGGGSRSGERSPLGLGKEAETTEWEG